MSNLNARITNMATYHAPVQMERIRKRPVIYVGVGAAGEVVINQLGQLLTRMGGTEWQASAPHVRLVQVNINKEDGGANTTRRHNLGYLEITLNVGMSKRRNMVLHEGINWIDTKGINAPGRALGRLAVFLDLATGGQNSRLWNAIVETVGSRRDIALFVVADSFNDESSAVFDIAHLYKTILPGAVTVSTLCLLMPHARWNTEMSEMERDRRTFAMLREVQRMQLRQQSDWNYLPTRAIPELHTTTIEPVLEQVYLFDGEINEQKNWNSVDASVSILPTVTEFLGGVLDREIAEKFDSDQKNENTAAALASDETRFGVLRSYCIRLPMDEMRSVLATRLVHRYLFDANTGILGWEELDEAGQSVRKTPVAVVCTDQDVRSFFIDQNISEMRIRQLSTVEIERYLKNYLEEKINASPPVSLRWISAFLTTLKAKYPVWSQTVDRYQKATQKWLNAAFEEARIASSAVSNPAPSTLPSSLMGKLLQKQVKEQATQPVSSVAAGRGEMREGSLYSMWREIRKTAIEEFQKVEGTPTQYSLWGLAKEYELFRQLNSAVSKLQEHIYWHWFEKGGEITLGVIIAPDDPDANDATRPGMTIRQSMMQTPVLFSFTADQTEAVVKDILRLANRFTRGITPVRFSGEFVNRNMTPERVAEEMNIRTLLGETYRQYSLSRFPKPAVDYYYLCAPMKDDPMISRIVENIRSQTGGSSGQLFHTISWDHYAMWMLRVCFAIPLFASESYLLSRGRYRPDATLHTLKEEQTATQQEMKAVQYLGVANINVPAVGVPVSFSSRWVRIVNLYPEAYAVLGQGVVYGIVQVDTATGKIIAARVDDLEDVVGLSAEKAIEQLQKMMDTNSSVKRMILTAINRKRPRELAQRIRWADEVKSRVVQPLIRSESLAAQDAGLWLSTILFDESN